MKGYQVLLLPQGVAGGPRGRAVPLPQALQRGLSVLRGERVHKEAVPGVAVLYALGTMLLRAGAEIGKVVERGTRSHYQNACEKDMSRTTE